MLGSGSAGNSALISTDHCRVLVDGGLSARQLVLRLEQCGLTPAQLDGVLLTHEHGDHVCGLEVLCRKFQVPIYCNSLTAEAIRYGCDSLGQHRQWRLFRTGAEFSICDIHVLTFPVPHDAVDPVGYAFHVGDCGLGFITDLGYPTKLLVERRQLSWAAQNAYYERSSILTALNYLIGVPVVIVTASLADLGDLRPARGDANQAIVVESVPRAPLTRQDWPVPRARNGSREP